MQDSKEGPAAPGGSGASGKGISEVSCGYNKRSGSASQHRRDRLCRVSGRPAPETGDSQGSGVCAARGVAGGRAVCPTSLCKHGSLGMGGAGAVSYAKRSWVTRRERFRWEDSRALSLARKRRELGCQLIPAFSSRCCVTLAGSKTL